MHPVVRILLVDGASADSGRLRELLEAMAWARPPRVDAVAGWREAIRAAAADRYDLVFAGLDADCPGAQAVGRLRSAGIGSPVVFLADDARDAEAAVAAVRAGAHDCLFRPVSAGRLAETVRTTTGGTRPRATDPPVPADVREATLLSIIENNCDGMLVLDRWGILRFANPAAQSLLNRGAAELLGQPFGHPVSVGDCTEIDLVAAGKVRTVEMRVAQINWEGAPALLAAIRDVTTRKRAQEAALRFNTELERRVAERTAQLEAASRAKDQFLAALSHELRTPLTPVLLTVGALEHEPGLSASTRDDLQTIRRNVELEARLIDDLLDLSRITRGKLQLNLQPTDPTACLRRAIEICQSDADQKDVRLATDLSAAADARVSADSVRLQQVFWNLLKNAVKFTPRGGHLTVRSTGPLDGWLRVEVRDSGVGIEPQILPRIFDPFEQGSPEVTRQFGGLGLGLAISKAIVDMHRGRLSADSAGKGLGATFVVELPVAVEHPVASPERRQSSASAEAGRGSSARLLLIDDHVPTLRIMTRLLNEMGHEVHSATNGVEAQSLVECNTFDLVISDLGLPDCTGHELLRKMESGGKRLKAIALSGYGREEDIERSLAVGFLAHLIKPVDVAKLQSTIEEALRTAAT